MNVSTHLNGMDAAKAFFKEERLLMPVIPETLQPDIKELGAGVFGTEWAKGKPLYDIYPFVQETMRDPHAQFLVFGQAGHGVNSWAMHYYLVHGPIALFIQLPYGGVYMSREASVGAITGAWGLLKDLLKAVDEMEVNAEERLYIVESMLSGCRWAWGERGDVVPEGAWKTQQPTFYNALRSIVLGRVA